MAALLLLRERRRSGLRELVAEEHLAQIDKAEVNAVRIGADADGRELVVRVWPNGANIERGDEKGPLPADLAPDELTVERAEELLASGAAGPRVLGADPETGLAGARAHRPLRSVRAARRAGATGSKEKPKRASLFASMDPDDGDARATRSRCCRCPRSSAPTPTASRSPRRTVATART